MTILIKLIVIIMISCGAHAVIPELKKKLEESQERERVQWMSHFDEQGKWRRDYVRLTEEEVFKIKKVNTTNENLVIAKKVIVELPQKIKKYEEELALFRERKSQAIALNRSELYKYTTERASEFMRSQQQANEIYKKNYDEMIILGQKLKSHLDSVKGAGK